jgi:hypothetical protein
VSVKLNKEERDALKKLTCAERLPATQVVRRLIWDAARQVPAAGSTPSAADRRRAVTP